MENEIDFNQLFNSLCRNRKLIFTFGLVGLLLSAYVAFSTKRTWRGDFQIVLESNAESQLPSLTSSRIAQFAGLRRIKNPLETEVGVLKSPSVLIDVFQFVKTKKALNDKSIKELRFKKWRESLKIFLEPGTSILNLSYEDNDKDIILPVLNKISTTYQEYSGKKRLRQLELSLNYLEEQIKIYKKRSIESHREKEQFALDQDISAFKTIGENDQSLSSTNIEIDRSNAANKIRILEEKFNQIKDLSNESEQIVYLAADIPQFENITRQLNELENRISQSRGVYKEGDKFIGELLNEKSLLTKSLYSRLKAYLSVEKSNAYATLRAAERPEGVLIKYKQLQTEANKDKVILNKLEDEYRINLLEKARYTDPWELITKPTLLESPVAPKRKRMLALGLLGGIFLGSFAALISEKRKNLIFSTKEIESLTELLLLAELSFEQKEQWEDALELVGSDLLADNDESLALVQIGEINDKESAVFMEGLRKYIKNRQIIITNKLSVATKYSKLILVVTIGATEKQDLLDVNKKLLLQKKPILGIIVLKDISPRI